MNTHNQAGPLRVGIVGAGPAAARVAEAARSLGHVVEGVADQPWGFDPDVEARVRATAAALGVTPYASIEELLENVDVVHVLSGTFEFVVAALNHQTPVVSGVPLGADLEQARRLQRWASVAQLVNAADLPARYMPSMTAMREWCTRGLLGSVVSVRAYLARLPPGGLMGAGQPPSAAAAAAVPLAQDLGVLFDLIETVTREEIAHVSVEVDGTFAGEDDTDAVACTIRTQTGAIGSISVARMRGAVRTVITLKITCEGGWLEATGPDRLEYYIDGSAASRAEFLPTVNAAGPMDEVGQSAALYRGVYEAIRAGMPRGAPGYPTFASGLRLWRLLRTAAVSAESRTSEPVI